jgi:hypothetical protein
VRRPVVYVSNSLPPCWIVLTCSVTGDHTRSIQIATPTVGGLMRFAVKTVTCLGCRTPLKSGKGTCQLTSLMKAKLTGQRVQSASIVGPSYQTYTKNRSVFLARGPWEYS